MSRRMFHTSLQAMRVHRRPAGDFVMKPLRVKGYEWAPRGERQKKRREETPAQYKARYWKQLKEWKRRNLMYDVYSLTPKEEEKLLPWEDKIEALDKWPTPEVNVQDEQPLLYGEAAKIKI
eukprot:gb/GEZN01016950.1/.p1 GENE.gb/GEZN01016950.1/~~gb/GEZN01016950.1/.p1  ORF type:complete len:121 (-),score=18.40 gb/GEZN01016950.1/:437-799(-)